MTSMPWLAAGPIKPTPNDLTRYQGRKARSLLTRAASHVIADPAHVGQWLAPSVDMWVATAGPLISQGAVTILDWSGDGKPLVPVVGDGFRIAEQAAQKTEVASAQMTVDPGTEPTTLAGYVNVARQALDFSDRNADLIFALIDVGAQAGFDKWIADRLVAAASTGHTDAGAAFASFPTDGIYTPSVLAAPPSYVLTNAAEVSALVAAGMRVVVDFRLSKPLVLDPLACVFVSSDLVRGTVDEPMVVGLQVGVVRYVSAGLSTAGIASIG